MVVRGPGVHQARPSYWTVLAPLPSSAGDVPALFILCEPHGNPFSLDPPVERSTTQIRATRDGRSSETHSE